MQTIINKPQMNVPTWLIVLELSVGVALLHICSTALLKADAQAKADHSVLRSVAMLTVPDLTNQRTYELTSLKK